MGKELPFLAFDLPVGLHFLSNSKNQIISTVIYKVRETVFLEKKKSLQMFSVLS